jgi:hypothetical protein
MFFFTITQKSEYDNFKAAQANADILIPMVLSTLTRTTTWFNYII